MLRPGTKIGGLRIDELLGRGAMGEVYRAEQISLKRPVAVKRIADHLLEQPEAVARFHREAQCLARVHSPHVVGVHDFGRMRADDGSEHWLLVMELVEGGRSLRAAVGKPMDWRPATALALQIAQGLAAAAELGVVHRDVKPDNVIVNTRRIAKLADFGLARSIDSTDMTVQGSVLGTPAYMPPEACRGEAVDARGDLYSLGATWYQLLTGRTPHQAENTPAMLRSHIDDEPMPLAQAAPEVPARVAELVHRCLAKERERRPTSAAALVADLRALAAQGIVLPDAVPLPEQTAPLPDPATAATYIIGGAAMMSSETATALPPTASTAPTVLLPQTAPVPRRRARRAVFGLAGVAVVGVVAAGIAVLARDPFMGERARVQRALAAGDYEIALRLADALATRWPDRREALDAERAVISAEIDRALSTQSFDQAREILTERRRGREWLDGEPLTVRIDLAQARFAAATNWQDSAKRFGDLRQRHPKDLAICQAMVETLGKESTEESVVDAALQLGESPEGPSPEALDVVVRAQRQWSPYSDAAKLLRAVVIRCRPQAIGEARANLDGGTSDDPDPRISAYLLLKEAGKLAPDEELRFHVRNFVQLSTSHTAASEALAWLQQAAAAPGWAERKAAAQLAPFAQVEGLNHEDEHEQAVEDLLIRAFVPEIKESLPRWIALTDDDHEDLRYHAWRLLHRAGLAEGFDDFAFHAETLRTFYPAYDRRVFDEALLFFRSQVGAPRAPEARAALITGEEHVEEMAALMDKNMPGVRGAHMRKKIPLIHAVTALYPAP